MSRTNKPTVEQRIDALRSVFSKERIEAFIVPGTDPHLSEYVAPHWKSRKWISRFTGSAGCVVVTRQEAGLWTDSRYFLQAAEELKGSPITLYKEMLPDTPTIAEFLAACLPAGSCVGIDGYTFSAEAVWALQKELSRYDICIRNTGDLLQSLWTDRPPMPEAAAFNHETVYAGKESRDKLKEIRQAMQACEANTLLLSALDEIAWTLNLRGEDVHCNPVVVSYLLIEMEEAHLFIDPRKLPEEVAHRLHEDGVAIHPYDTIESHLERLAGKNVSLNPARTNYTIYTAISADANRIIHAASPVCHLKAIRNSCETEGIRRAMQRDGVALVRFLMWLEKAVPAGNETEISVGRKLQAFRAQHPLYKGDSFDTIAGYKEHAAIVHYKATPETDSKLSPKGFLLLDSGAQYPDGTTDITRTIALGELTDEEKTDYTLVLKGHIALAMAVFPAGTRGTQLDVLARMPLWKHRMNYLHGTGHGVGHFLNVHEGPQSIRMNENPTPLQPGMVTSNEPGVYKAGSHGIRIENLTLVIPAGEGMFGDYLAFETLTLCPICTRGIKEELLTEEEHNWLKAYHKMVYDRLAPALNKEEQEWLASYCK